MEELVKIGNGMAGVACLEQILKHKKKFDITIFGDETHANYNRILLSSVLAGERQSDDITINGLDWYQTNGIGLRLGVRIINVNSRLRTITGDDGSVVSYDKLIIATGSRPFIPRIEGIEKRNVFTFRNLDDTRQMLAHAGKGRKAVVIGGGLLGLEAARGLQLRGCDVTVVHLLDHLMNMQLDSTGGLHLKRKIEELGVRVICQRVTSALLGNGHVEAVKLDSGDILDADFVVIAAGIRPNAELGVAAGLKVNRGIVVNDFMETSNPNIFAVGECVEHDGETFGLVAPLFEQGKVLAATITGNRGPVFTGWKPAAKLKIMGVDVFSAGNFAESPDMEIVRYEDAAMGVYKKLLVRKNRLAGVILVGDASDSNRYMEWLRHDTDLVMHRRNLLFPEPVADHGEGVAEIADSETVCGCLGVSKGQIISAIHEKGINTMAQLKECTRASTGCGSCSATCQQILKAVAPQFEEETRKVLCACVPFTQENLREMIRSQQLRSVQDVLNIYGNGAGCEICKPALSYLVDVVWCGDHEEDRSARFINDRVHANIQNDGTFSVIPRIRGGVTTPAELRRIANAAEKYHARMVKITGSQRIDLLGIKKADLPRIWADLGMPSGQAYTKGVRMVKTCVGTEFCRFGVQDAISAGVELERRLENLYTPHKTKMGVTGCPRNCAEVTVKDIGLVGQEGSWQVVVGGAAGKQRLVGSSDWNNTARSFDAVRLTLHPMDGVRVDAFASSVVVQVDGTFDHHHEGDDLHGLYGSLSKLVPDAVIEPYEFWRVQPRQANEDGQVANLSEFTTGVHWTGKLPHGFDYGTEMDLQRGSLGAEQVKAWAGHWVAGYTIATLNYKPRFLLEYNYAAGDHNSKDNIRGTFDQLYPTAHNKYGLLDQVGWKNIKDLRTGVEMKPARRWTTSAIFHDWYLADPHDALYNAASAVVARNPAGVLATHIGEELDGQASVALSPIMQIAFGVGHIFPGEFLLKATPGKSYTYPYLMFTYAF